MERLEGEVLRVLFRDATSLYTVARFRTPEGEVGVTGPFLEIAEGDRFELDGEWTRHPKYGRQFAAASHRKLLPETAAGIEAYLASGLFKGIGKKLAGRLVKHFGDQTLTVLMQDPERVREVPGVGRAKLRSLVESLGEYGRVQALAVFLQSHGISMSLTLKIHKRYGERAIELVKVNPYRLAREVEGIGFLTADEIARKLGTNPADPERIKAAVQYALSDRAEAEGHVFLPLSELVARTVGLTGVRPPLVHDAVAVLVEQGLLVRDQGDAIYRRELYEAEADLASRLRDLMMAELPVAAAVVDEVERELGVTYAPEQRQAVLTALGSQLAVITGGPGTGKSTVLKGVLAALRKLQPDATVLLAAPTGRAARRMTDVTGEPASTIHRLLGYNPQENAFAADESSPLAGHLLVVDECSMIDLNLAAALFAAVPEGMRVLLVGDADQLPSVGTGNVLADLIGSGVVPVVRLTRIYRQSGESRIVLNAHRINAGQMPDLRPADDFAFVAKAEPTEIARYIRDRALAARDGGATLDQITVLTPMRKTETGVEALNQLLQEALNPPRPGRPQVVYGSVTLRLGDKVMQRKNNYEKEVFNGSVGVVTAVDEDDGELAVTFEDEQLVTYAREDLDQLTLAYACTVHKAQGSEYGGLVMIPMTLQHAAMLQRNLLYTALTRAKQMAVLVGTQEAVARAVRNNRITRRHSRLAARLRGEAQPMELPPLQLLPAPVPAAAVRPQEAAALYVAARERRGGASGWAAIRVQRGEEPRTFSGAVPVPVPKRLLATAAAVALQDLSPDVAVALCVTEKDFLVLLESDVPAPAEVTDLRELLSRRVWKGSLVEAQEPMARECMRLATLAGQAGGEVSPDAEEEDTAARHATRLATLGGAGSVKELYALLAHAGPRARAAACRAVGKLRPAGAVERLCTMLADPDHRVRQAALTALEQAGSDASCLEPLNELLQREEREPIRQAAEAMLKGLLKPRP